MRIAGFEWDDANRDKCRKHGVPLGEIEGLFARPIMILPDDDHSTTEKRFRAIGKTQGGRYIFLVFTIHARDGTNFIRPISARYMHRKEIEHYAKENPDLQD